MQFKMNKDLKKRIFTSLVLTLILFTMFINNYVLGYFSLIAGVFSILEFFNMNLIIFKKNNIKQFLYSLLFILYIFIFFSLFLFLSSFIHLKILIFVILLICVASDVGGFVFGKIFKGAKLTKISPNKTISGALGSLIFSSIFAVLIIYYLTNSFDVFIFVIALFTSIGCQIGDLFFSFLKRKSFLKDTANYLPGHGGILDRIDGMLLGIPLGFLTLILIY